MFEIGETVKFRQWSDKEWEDDTYEVIDIETSWIHFTDTYYSFTIKNLSTHEIKVVCWQQIESI